jgi:hypothetical protein
VALDPFWVVVPSKEYLQNIRYIKHGSAASLHRNQPLSNHMGCRTKVVRSSASGERLWK